MSSFIITSFCFQLTFSFVAFIIIIIILNSALFPSYCDKNESSDFPIFYALEITIQLDIHGGVNAHHLSDYASSLSRAASIIGTLTTPILVT